MEGIYRTKQEQNRANSFLWMSKKNDLTIQDR